MTNIFILSLTAFAVCLILTPLVRRLAVTRGWIARPAADRWHKKPTALSGGIAIYLGIAIPLFVISDFHAVSLPHPSASDTFLIPSFTPVLWIGITVMFLLGLVDDRIRLKPQTKLLGQILAASMVAFLGFRLHWLVSMTLDTLLTIFWIVGITNAFNLLDNMDGLCAGIAAVSAIFLTLIYAGICPELAMASAIIAGACAAFLVYNFNPASIFMGDCGSLMIGFAISMLCLGFSEKFPGNMMASIAVPVMIVMVPISDTTMVTLIRLLSGRKASTGGKDHTSHRLVLLGFSEKNAVLFLYGIGLISGTAALLVSRSDTLSSPSVIIPVTLAILLMGVYLSQLRIYPEKEFSALRDQVFSHILIDLTYKKQLVLVILDFCLVAFSYYLSYRLRFNSTDFGYYFKIFLKSLPAVIICKLLIFYIVGVYRGVWGYLNSNDVVVYIKASVIASFLSVTTVTFIYGFKDFSKAIFVIDCLITTSMVLGSRGFFRLFGDAVKRKTLSGEQVFIYGAGRGGEILLREILYNKKHHVKPIGFIDDDPLKIGKKLQGYPILGAFGNMEDLIQKYPVTTLLVSFIENDIEHHKFLKEFCRMHDLYLKQFSVHIEPIDTEAP